jgi:hypothetical protein
MVSLDLLFLNCSRTKTEWWRHGHTKRPGLRPDPKFDNYLKIRKSNLNSKIDLKITVELEIFSQFVKLGINYPHSNEKLRVFATEAFHSEKSTETSNYSTEVSVETHETFESISRSPKFRFC